MTIEQFASTKRYEAGSVGEYQNMQTQITVNIITLEIAKDVKVRIDRACIYANSASAQQQTEKK